MKLTGQRCQCPDCLEYFNSVAAFDRHRDGSHKKQTRHCLNPADIGMVRNEAGFWITSPMPKISKPAFLAFTSRAGGTISPSEGGGTGRAVKGVLG